MYLLGISNLFAALQSTLQEGQYFDIILVVIWISYYPQSGFLAYGIAKKLPAIVGSNSMLGI